MAQSAKACHAILYDAGKVCVESLNFNYHVIHCLYIYMMIHCEVMLLDAHQLCTFLCVESAAMFAPPTSLIEADKQASEKAAGKVSLSPLLLP